MKQEVEELLKQIRIALQQGGGDLELVEVDEKEGIVKVRLLGACAGCPFSQFTITNYVEKTLKEHIPGVKQVINLNLQQMYY